MDKKFLPENDTELHEAFGEILSIERFSEPVKEIIQLIFNNTLDKNNLDNLLIKYKLSSLKNIKEELLDVLIIYINIILNDHIITENELRNIRIFKSIFKIQEGDFYKYRYNEINDILSRQFLRIYRDDDKIDETEALHKVALQKLFDLSYDQMLEFNEKEIIAALARGANIIDLDTVYKKKFLKRYSKKLT